MVTRGGRSCSSQRASDGSCSGSNARSGNIVIRGNDGRIGGSGITPGSENNTIALGSQMASQRTRGPTHGIPLPEDGQERLLVIITGDSFEPRSAVNKIRVIFKIYYRGLKTRWGDWSQEEREILWEEFLNYFRFDSLEETIMGKAIFMRLAKDNFPKFLKDAKDNAEKAYGSIAAAKAHTPDWTTTAVWAALCNYWMTPDYVKSCELRKRNRHASYSHPHTSGPIPYGIRTERKRKELRHTPTQYEIYVHTHTHKKKGSQVTSFVTERAKAIADEYEARLLESNPDTDLPVNEIPDPGLKAWIGTVGIKKGRVLGRPGERWSKRADAYHSTQYQSAASMEKIKSLQDELKLANEKIAAQNQAIIAQNHALAAQYEFIKELSAHAGYRDPPNFMQSSTATTSGSVYATSSTADQDM